MISIIINADDLGLNHKVNNAIDQALSVGKVTSSTIMANTEYWDEVIDIVNRYPENSFGVHLNLTQGVSLTKNSILRKYHITDENDCFLKNGIYGIREFDASLLGAIYQEWDAQIKIVLENGVRISHIDGHHHVHTIYSLLPALLSLKKEYDIKMNRSIYRLPLAWKLCKSSNKTSTKMIEGSVNRSKRAKPNLFFDCLLRLQRVLESCKWRFKMVIAGGIMTDYFDSYEDLLLRLGLGLKLPNDATIELMCHPGHPNYKKEMNDIYRNQVGYYLQDYRFISYLDLE